MFNLIREKAVLSKNKNQRGAVLIFSFLVSTVLLILLGGHMSMMINEGNMTARSYSSIVAMNVAEAGVERAIWELNYGGGDFLVSEGWSGTNPKVMTDTLQTAGGITIGEYTVTVTDPTGPNPEIETTGYAPTQSLPEGQRAVKVVLETQAETLFSAAAFGNNGVRLDTGCITDSYDSRLGPYDVGTAGDNGDVRTNSTADTVIDLGGTATVNGDAIIGPGGDPSTAITDCDSGDCTITGDKTAASALYSLPSVSPPSGLPVEDDIILGSSATITISSSGQYSTIDLGKNSVITIDSDVTLYITNLLNLDRDSQISIINDADVEIYLDGSLTFDRGSLINNVSQDPTKLSLYGTDSFVDPPGLEGAIDIDRDSTLYGTIYAPNATVDIDRGGQIYGAIVAQSVQVDQGSGIHFDEALLDMGGGSGSSYAISSWQEK